VKLQKPTVAPPPPQDEIPLSSWVNAEFPRELAATILEIAHTAVFEFFKLSDSP
jgi:hypothetical protein